MTRASYFSTKTRNAYKLAFTTNSSGAKHGILAIDTISEQLYSQCHLSKCVNEIVEIHLGN